MPNTYFEAALSSKKLLEEFEKYNIQIFSYNVQILQLLKSPKDAWTRVVRKLANDVVYRIFNYFKNEEISTEERLTKKLFLNSFQRGKSTPRKIKGMTNWGETHVGREILIINNNEETEKVSTSDLFNHPIPFDIRDNKYFCRTEDSERSTFNLRHCFEFECCEHQMNPSSELNEFSIVDQRKTLFEMKTEIEKDLLYKFMSNDEKIISTLREVFVEELHHKISTSFEKTDKKIDNVSDQVEQISQQVEQVSHVIVGQDDMLERIYMRLKRMEEK